MFVQGRFTNLPSFLVSPHQTPDPGVQIRYLNSSSCLDIGNRERSRGCSSVRIPEYQKRSVLILAVHRDLRFPANFRLHHFAPVAKRQGP